MKPWMSLRTVTDIMLDTLSFLRSLREQGHIVYTDEELTNLLDGYPSEFQETMRRFLR